MMRGTPAGDSGTPEAIALAAVYLASDESSFVHANVFERQADLTSGWLDGQDGSHGYS
jgi:NAD(P)-dependent dehydrogenase (short-subunit alcohol dehydrogenase family)